MAERSSFSFVLGAWRQRNFAWYMSGATVSLVGNWAQRIAVMWLAWELEGSTVWLGVIAFADLFPTVVITPIAGAYADRGDRLRMSRISQIMCGLQAFVLAGLTFAGLIEIWSLFGLTIFLGIAMAFSTAARLSMVPNLLEREFVPAALASDSAIYNSARVVGPMIAAGLIKVMGIGGAFLINGLAYIVFVVCLYRVRLLRTESARGVAGNVLQQTVEGVRYAAGHPGIGPILLVLTAVAVGVKPFLELLPALADTVFHMKVDGLAILAAAGGAGAVTAAVFLAVRGRPEGLTAITLSALALGMVGVVILCGTGDIRIGIVGAFLGGAAVTLSGTGTQTLMQNAVAGAIRGRVMSLYGMIHRGAPAIGALVMGIGAKIVGLELAIAGLSLLLCLSILVWVMPRRRRMTAALERRQDEAADAAAVS